MLILADTSIWVNHLRTGNSLFKAFLEDGVVLMHPCVRHELSMGHLKNRARILSFMAAMPEAEVAADDEVQHVVETRKLFGVGIGWIDAHLLAATLLTQTCSLWTLDGPLRAASQQAGALLFHGTV
jgi:predicted nucleic acid-binding protein